MEKNTARNGTGYKRLLKPLLMRIRKGLAVILFSRCFIAGYGEQNGNSIELRMDEGICFIDREYEIEVFIKNDSQYFKHTSDIPRLTLEYEDTAVQLIQSSVMPESDGLHIRCRCRFTEAGNHTLVPVLRWERQTVRLEPLSLTVHRLPLSEQTEFLWKLYDADGAPISDRNALEQGHPYLLLLTAAFYSADSTGNAAPVAAGASEEIPLPAELLRIDCSSPENAVLQPLTPKELPPTAKTIVSGAIARHSNETDSRIFSEALSDSAAPAIFTDEEYALAAFSWIPLQPGIQELPKAHLFFVSGEKAASSPAAYHINARTFDGMPEKEQPPEYSYEAFTEEAPQDTLSGGSSLTEEEEIETAKRIAELRRQELFRFFPFGIRRERKKLEAILNITHPLPVYSRIVRIAAIAATALLLGGAAVCRLGKKKRLMLLFIALAACCGSGATVLFRHVLQPQGVCITCSEDAAVRRIPDNSGSIVHRLNTGESVIIIRETTQWYYIKTTGGITGWVPQRSLMPYLRGSPGMSQKPAAFGTAPFPIISYRQIQSTMSPDLATIYP